MMLSSIQPFVRNRLTWLAYAMLAYFGFTQSMLGPLMPFLRTELRLNYALDGFLPAALALGLILSGLFGDWFARHWSRRVVFWMGGVGLAVCVVLLSLSRQFELVLVAVLGMGIGSSLTRVMIQALLADQHGERRAIAFTEANVAASLSATLTSFVIGGLQGAGVSWRAISIPAIIFLAVWATDFLANVAGLSRTNAALSFGAFPAAMLTGRIAGSRFTRHWSSLRLLLASLGITLIGFLIFWLTRVSALNILGLFVAGLGIANLYPLTLSIAMGLAAGQSNQASARVSLGVGTALLTAPLLLGWLADRLGLQNAYGIVTILAITAITIIVMNNGLPFGRKEAAPL